MRIHLRMPERQETAVEMNLIPKAGEHLEFGGTRYVVVSVTHEVDTAKMTVELAKVSFDDTAQRLRLNELIRYRTTEIKAFSPPSRPRLIR